jgi:hypothetical protein
VRPKKIPRIQTSGLAPLRATGAGVGGGKGVIIGGEAGAGAAPAAGFTGDPQLGQKAAWTEVPQLVQKDIVESPPWN